MRERVVAVVLGALATLAVSRAASAQTAPLAPLSKVTFEDAIRIALEKNPRTAEAEQSTLRAEALLQQARTVFRPTLSSTVVTNVLDSEPPGMGSRWYVSSVMP